MVIVALVVADRTPGEGLMTTPPQKVLSFFAEDADFATLSEIADAARAGLASDVRDFLDGGAGREVTVRRNRQAFDRWAYRPRVMTGVGAPELATSFLGLPLGLPILTAPFG